MKVKQHTSCKVVIYQTKSTASSRVDYALFKSRLLVPGEKKPDGVIDDHCVHTNVSFGNLINLHDTCKSALNAYPKKVVVVDPVHVRP